MTKRLQQLVSWYLALSFAFAGMVAINPFLHQQVEHAGEGAAHSHYGKVSESESHPRAEERAISEIVSRIPANHPLLHRHNLDCRDLAKLWSLLGELFGQSPGTGSVPCSGDAVPDHDHDSLPQSLARGLLEQPLDLPLVQQLHLPVLLPSELPDVVLYIGEWNAQTASRGPPFHVG